MKRIVLLVAFLAIVAVVVGCGGSKMSPTEKKLSELVSSGFLPRQVVFAKHAMSPDSHFVDITEMTARTDWEGGNDFITYVGVNVDGMGKEDLRHFYEDGPPELGCCLDATIVPDTLKDWYMAWIVCAAGRCNRARIEYEQFCQSEIKAGKTAPDTKDYGYAKITKTRFPTGDSWSM